MKVYNDAPLFAFALERKGDVMVAFSQDVEVVQPGDLSTPFKLALNAAVDLYEAADGRRFAKSDLCGTSYFLPLERNSLPSTYPNENGLIWLTAVAPKFDVSCRPLKKVTGDALQAAISLISQDVRLVAHSEPGHASFVGGNVDLCGDGWSLW